MSVLSLKRTRQRVKGSRIKKEISADLIWERPADWPQLPVVLSSESKFVGLHKVENHDLNYVALTMTVASGTWDVDWGDGTSSTACISGATYSHAYTYSDAALGAATSEGFKCAVVTVKPSSGSGNFTVINLNTKASAYGANTTVSTGWLEMRMSMPGITSNTNFLIGNGSSMLHRNCRQFEYIGTCGVINGTAMFGGFASLESLKVPRSFTAAMTNMTTMFNGCVKLKYVPDLDMAAVTNPSLCFASCTQLRRVPDLYLPLATNLASMFQACPSLESVPDLTTGAVTTVANMFNGCSSLKVAPAISNTASCVTWTSMFLNCSTLRSVPAYNTSAGTTFNGMFQGCLCLPIVPALDLSAVTGTAGFSNMFTSCMSLVKSLVTGAKYAHSYGASQLSASALDVLYTNLGTASGAQTITVSGCAGIASDTPSIATAKGWTVSGS